MKTTGIYLRVSTNEQNVRSQKAAVLEHCDRKGWKRRVIFAETESGRPFLKGTGQKKPSR